MSVARIPLRVLLVAPERHALRQPHAGGLEAVVWNRARWLRSRGHEVVLCAAAGSDLLGPNPSLHLPSPRWTRAADASDSEYPEGHRRAMAAAFARVADHIARDGGIDVVDNHSLHGAPVRWSRTLGIPVVTTLHTPPLPDMVVAAAAISGAPHRFLAVSQYTAQAWSAEGIDAIVIPNGVDTDHWTAGAGGSDWVWSGRIGDEGYFAREVRPLLGPDARYAGALRQPELNALVGAAAVALVTPVWSEPFGLVLAEALATGTPVAAFDSGGIREVLSRMPGTAVVPAGDVVALSRAASALAAAGGGIATRRAVRRAAEARYSLAQRQREVERVLLHAASDAPHRGLAAEAVAQVGA
ncbi:glycosyltransferase [Microbacterium aurantiacum]|uniref:glycosyltransferase n=1 Tax=Microbacterium aurantiacum TaxID=162393 RepID=UPI003F49A0C6